MYRFPLVDIIAEYFKRLWSYGFTWCFWVVIVGFSIGIGIIIEQWILITAGVGVWVIGGLILAYERKVKKE